MPVPVIEVKSLSKVYENEGVKTPVLFDVDLTIPKGQFVAIMGPSGSGKSTLMHILGFLDQASNGTYHFCGRDVTNVTEAELAVIRNQEVGFVFQAFFLLAHSTVLDNILLPLRYDDRDSRAEQKKRAIAAAESVGLSHRLNYLTSRLSGGEKQRVAIARALVTRPAVIFADEPTGNLDSRSGAQVMYLLQELHKKGHSIVMVTHESSTAEHAERIVRMRDGKILSDEMVTERRIAAPESELAK